MSQVKSHRPKSGRVRKNVRDTAANCRSRHEKSAPRTSGQNVKVAGSNSLRSLRNVFEAILKYGHDEDFAPAVDGEFCPTEAPAGSKEKLDVLAARVLRGEPLWHPEDRPDYSGLTGAVRPRD